MSSSLMREEKLLAKVFFRTKLLKANGEAFQQLFWAVMRAKHGQEFVEIRPQGRKGDGGNDGYLPAEGHYYQVFGPIDPAEKVTTAAAKLATDFRKLKKAWNQATPIRAYSFVFNDKYEGTFAEIAKALANIEKANPGMTCRPHTAASLEDDFLALDPDKIQDVLEMILPDPSKLIRVQYSALKEVIAFIMNSPTNAIGTTFGDLPDLVEKIKLNHLCSAWSDMIRNGARHAGHVDDYFAKNSTFMKQALRDHLVQIYEGVRDQGRALAQIPSGTTREDLVFTDFRNGLMPQDATLAISNAVDVLIGYYFEACDVFDPYASKDTPNASP